MQKSLNEQTIIIALFLLNLIFRFSLISQGPYHSDCLFLASQAEKTLTSLQLQYVQPPGFPLTVLLGSVFIYIIKALNAGDIIFSVNLMSVLFSSLSVVALYLFVRNLFDSKTAFISALLLTFNPMLLSLSTFGNSHPISLFFFLLSLYHLTNFIKTRRGPYLYLGGISLGLMGAARFQDIAIAFFLIVFIALSSTESEDNKSFPSADFKSRLLSLVILFVAAFVTIGLFYIPAVVDNHFGANASSLAIIKDRLTNHFLPYTTTAIINVLKLFLTTFSVFEWIAGATGFFLISKKNGKLALLLLLWFLLPFVLFLPLRFFVLRLALFSVIPIIICTSYLLAKYPQKFSLRVIALLAAFLAVGVNLNNYLPTVYFRSQNALLPDFFEWIGEATEPNAYIIERDHSLFIQFYAKRKPLGPDISLYGYRADAFSNFKQSVDSLLNQDIPVYITKYGLFGYSSALNFKDFMQDNYQLEYIGGRQIEDWHISALEHVTKRNDLFKIKKKTP